MSSAVRNVLPLLAIAAVTMAASCEPVKKTPSKDVPPGGQGGENIAYYFAVDGDTPDGANLDRSPVPFTEVLCDEVIKIASTGGPGTNAVSGPPLFGEASQILNPNGSVTLDLEFPDASPCDTGVAGFAVVVGAVSDLATSTVGTTAGSDAVAAILAFDADGDGNFGGTFDSDGNGTGFGNDVLCGRGGPGSITRGLAEPGGNTPPIDDLTEFNCLVEGATAGPFTLAQLKVGVMGLGDPSVNPDTPVAILVGLHSTDGDANATVNSLTINGVEQL